MSNDVDKLATGQLKPDVNIGLVRVCGSLFAEPVASFPAGASVSASGRSRVGLLHALFDGKTLNADDSLIFENVGTGSAAYSGSNVALSVTDGQYIIRNQVFHNPYFSGKPQHVEQTAIGLHCEAGVLKRIGYFSSNIVEPYNSDLDGYWIEITETDKFLVTSRNGTETHRINITAMDQYNLIESYDWSKFTVLDTDFLWLGGALLRFFMVVDGKFELIHAIDQHAGFRNDLIFQSPNHPIRAEVRSTGGAGSMTFCCVAVSSEGGEDLQGRAVPVYNPTPLSCNSSGTIYALCGIRIDTAHHDRRVVVTEISGGITSASNDAGMFLLCHKPTLSAPLTWTNKQRISSGVASANTTVSNTGTEVLALAVVSNTGQAEVGDNMLATLRLDIQHVPQELVLCYIPATSNQSVTGVINAKVY